MVHFWNLHQILNILKKNMLFIATLFRKLLTVRDLVTTLTKKHRSRTPFDSQHIKGSKGRVKSAWKNFYHIFSSLCEKLIWKICPLVISEFLGVCGETLTAKQKYPVWDFENLTSPIQMELSKKRNIFGPFFIQFLESTSNFKHFGKKNDLRS